MLLSNNMIISPKNQFQNYMLLCDNKYYITNNILSINKFSNCHLLREKVYKDIIIKLITLIRKL